MAIRRLGHVVLKVRDLDRSERFYADVLGLKVSGRLSDRMVFFTVPGNEDSHDLALFRVGPGAGGPARDQVGLFHVAWQVDRPEDLEALHAHLRAKGVPISGTTDHGANLSVYFEDPDGNQLELTYERPRAEWPAGQNPFAGRAPLPFAAGGR